MSVSFLICLILAEFLTFIYTAPKLGPELLDLLTYESFKFIKRVDPPGTSNDVMQNFLRAYDGRHDKSEDTAKKPCIGYDYDDTICKFVGDRTICGYNKNMGELIDSATFIDIGNGCFLRDDRIECGYVLKSYQNSGQPSANNQIKSEDASKALDYPSTKNLECQSTKTEVTTNESTTESSITNTEATRISESRIKDGTIQTETNMNESSTKNSTTKKKIATNHWSTENQITNIKITNKNESNSSDEIVKTNATTHEIITASTNSNKRSITDKSTSSILIQKINLILTTNVISNGKPTITTTEQSAGSEKYILKCVEKNDRLYCYELK